jgi:hypothetical protein
MVLSTQQFGLVVNYLRASGGVATGSEKRRATRMELKAKINVAPITNAVTGSRVSVLTRDISIEGVGLTTGVPMRQAQKFIALLPTSEDDTLFVLCEVLHAVVVADGIFNLGCRFNQVLSKQTAQQLQDRNQTDVARIRDSILSNTPPSA